MARCVRPGVASTLVLALAVGCSGKDFEDRTAVVEIDGASTTFTVDSCGLDGETVFVVGRSAGGATLQAVVGVQENDHETGIPDLTGVSVTDASSDRQGFGAGSWELRDMTGRAPGRIDEARVRGARIQVSGALEAVDASGRVPEAPGPTVAFSLDARCDEV